VAALRQRAIHTEQRYRDIITLMSRDLVGGVLAAERSVCGFESAETEDSRKIRETEIFTSSILRSEGLVWTTGVVECLQAAPQVTPVDVG